MKTSTGTREHKKVVFAEQPGGRPLAVSGEVALTADGEFYTIATERGEVIVAKKCVICIKNSNSGGRE